MKMLIAPLLSIALLAGCAEEADTPADTAAPATAQPTTMATPDADAQPMGGSEAATTASARGTVESVDPAAGRIVIVHGPVEALKWPAMTMGFTATPEQMDAVEAGQEIEFQFISQGASNTIVSITPVR